MISAISFMLDLITLLVCLFHCGVNNMFEMAENLDGSVSRMEIDCLQALHL